MPRGRRRSSVDVSALEQEMEMLKQRQSELRQQIRRLKNSQSEVGKLEEKVAKQFASAKWTVQAIKEVRPDWDDWAFYQTVEAKQPTPRGRRRRTPAGEEE